MAIQVIPSKRITHTTDFGNAEPHIFLVPCSFSFAASHLPVRKPGSFRSSTSLPTRLLLQNPCLPYPRHCRPSRYQSPPPSATEGSKNTALPSHAGLLLHQSHTVRSFIFVIVLLAGASTLTVCAAGTYTCTRFNQLSATVNAFPVELPSHDENEACEEEEEHDDEEELRYLERYGYAPGNLVEVGTAQAVRICPPCSAPMVDVRSGGGGGGGRRDQGLRGSRSVRDVGKLPDLSSAQAFLTPSGENMREEVVTKVEMATQQPEEREPMGTRPEKKEGLRRTLRKRISTQRFQGGGMRELVRSFGF